MLRSVYRSAGIYQQTNPVASYLMSCDKLGTSERTDWELKKRELVGRTRPVSRSKLGW